MLGSYIRAVIEASPQARIIFDRFHVQRLAHHGSRGSTARPG
ncbi:MAG: transposase [Myxococcales bacterium]|nr:transposase [Myxococcales bacterium]